VDVTSEVVKRAQFRQAWKGYDTAEVDDFLDEVAVGLDRTEARLRDALERLSAAEERALTAETRPAARPEPDGSVRRTLVLAQRAADLVVTEAKAVADRIVADAREQAARTMEDADAAARGIHEHATARAAMVVGEAEATAERMTAQRAAELQHELEALVEHHARRRLELERLHARIEATRRSFADQLEGQLIQLRSYVPEPLDDDGRIIELDADRSDAVTPARAEVTGQVDAGLGADVDAVVAADALVRADAEPAALGDEVRAVPVAAARPMVSAEGFLDLTADEVRPLIVDLDVIRTDPRTVHDSVDDGVHDSEISLDGSVDGDDDGPAAAGEHDVTRSGSEPAVGGGSGRLPGTVRAG
jgi:DivIVA domain-containing protein